MVLVKGDLGKKRSKKTNKTIIEEKKDEELNTKI
jgi:hypothetical protein